MKTTSELCSCVPLEAPMPQLIQIALLSISLVFTATAVAEPG
jgi:hypothetical protein